MISTTSAPTRVLLAIASLATVAASCGNDAGADKVGGQGDVEAVTLVMAQPNHGVPEQLVVFAAEVGELSGGTVTIEFLEAWRIGETDYEARTVEDVQAGEVDMAWVGARVFDEIGVNSFQPLVAPMLIDSHDLQGAVFEAGIPDEMLAGLEDIDLAGIGVLPGPMRKILGIDHPFVAPADFDGAVVGIQQSGVADQTMAALDATTKDLPSGADIAGVDAYEQQMASIAGNQYWLVADYVTANINLWPRPLVMFMNQDVFDSLSEVQQEALTNAATAAIPGALEASRTEDNEGAAQICGSEMTIIAATDDDLAGLATALEPVFDQLAAAPAAGEHLDAIRALKDELDVPPDSAQCVEDDTGVTASTSTDDLAGLNGTYQWTQRQPADENEADFVPSTWTAELRNGEFWITQSTNPHTGFDHGTYSVFEDHIEFVIENGVTLAFTFVTDQEGNLTLTPAEPMNPFDVFYISFYEWIRVDDGDQQAAQVDDSTVLLEGSFESTRYASDAPDCPAWASAIAEDDPGQMQVTFTDGEYVLSDDSGTVLNSGTYELFRDRVEVSGEIDARWWFDGTNLSFTDLQTPDGTPMPCEVETMWAARPWVFVSEEDAPPSESTALGEEQDQDATAGLDGNYEWTLLLDDAVASPDRS